MRRMFSQKQIEKIAEEIAKSINGTEIKYGYYIYKSEEGLYGYVGEDVPADFNGIAIGFWDDGIEIGGFTNGAELTSAYISTDSFQISDSTDNESSSFTKNGATKLDFTSLTHSFNELNPTLQTLITNALNDDGSTGVACTAEEWLVIKALLDKSLYIDHNFRMIKTSFDENNYVFGATADEGGSTLWVQYDEYESGHELKMAYSEV